MKFLILSFLLISSLVFATAEDADDAFLNNSRFTLSKSDHIIAEHMISMIKFIENGYINQEILKKIIRETEKSRHFQSFVPWLREISIISNLTTPSSIIFHCQKYLERKQVFAIERSLEQRVGNYCRERALEIISRDIEARGTMSDEASVFIQQNLKFFIRKKNKKHFAYFLQSKATRPEILKKLSQDVTTYSVQNSIVPSQEVLKDLLIDEQITKLIEDKGFNPLQHQNVFYAEYGKLVEQGYRLVENKSTEDKIRQHYIFLRNYLDLNEDHLPVGLCLTRMNDFSKTVFRSGFKELSREMLNHIIKKNNKEILEDAQFFYLWTYLYNSDYRGAQKIATKLGLIKNRNNILDSRLKFWIALTFEKLGETKDAVKLYEAIIVQNPLSYYSIMANKKLLAFGSTSSVAPSFFQNSPPPKMAPLFTLSSFDDDHISSIVRLKAWAKIDSKKMMNLELKRLNNHSLQAMVAKTPVSDQLSLKSDLHLLYARIIQGSNNYLATFRYLYQALDKKEVIFNKRLLEVLYPSPYMDLLSNNAHSDGVDPIVLLSLIRQESVFNPEARSPVGARGLMQLMPNTAKRFRRSVREQQLSNPKLNIELGTRYFKALMKRYNGNLVYVLAAYNAGEARVERWKNQYFLNDESILTNIEAIPFSETRNYVKLIFRNIFFYKLLLDKKSPLTDPGDHNKIFDVHLGFNK
jgi:soluble lytic murein transglycosylase